MKLDRDTRERQAIRYLVNAVAASQELKNISLAYGKARRIVMSPHKLSHGAGVKQMS